MAPSTVTETIEQFYATSKEIQLTQQVSDTKEPTNDNVKLTKNVSLTPYDEALNRTSESKFMKPIRDWERRMGFVTPILWVNAILILTFHLVTTLWYLNDIAHFVFAKWLTIAFGKFLYLRTHYDTQKS